MMEGGPILGQVSKRRRRQTPPIKAITGVRRLLDQNIEEIPSLTELAEAVGMDRFRLSRTFRKCVGMSLRAYVRELRLKRACELLAISPYSITTTSFECGFYDLPHFDRVFRRCFGITPSQYRQRHTVQTAARPRPRSSQSSQSRATPRGPA
jgi:transcriptional regulator GlxA family with amidase domain